MRRMGWVVLAALCLEGCVSSRRGTGPSVTPLCPLDRYAAECLAALPATEREALRRGVVTVDWPYETPVKAIVWEYYHRAYPEIAPWFDWLGVWGHEWRFDLFSRAVIAKSQGNPSIFWSLVRHHADVWWAGFLQGIRIGNTKKEGHGFPYRLRMKRIITGVEVELRNGRDIQESKRLGLEISGVRLEKASILGRCTGRKGLRFEFGSLVGQRLILDAWSAIDFALVRETPVRRIELEHWCLTSGPLFGKNVIQLHGLDGDVLHLRLEPTEDTKY